MREGGGVCFGRSGCVVSEQGPGTLSRGPIAGRSPQRMDVFILSVLYSVGIPTGALVKHVAGHGEGNHLDRTDRDTQSQPVIDSKSTHARD